MVTFEIKKIADNPQLIDMAANWFHLKKLEALAAPKSRRMEGKYINLKL